MRTKKSASNTLGCVRRDINPTNERIGRKAFDYKENAKDATQVLLREESSRCMSPSVWDDERLVSL